MTTDDPTKATPRPIGPRARARPVPDDAVECRLLEIARPGAVLRGPRPRHDPPGRRPGGGRGRVRPARCAPTTTRSAPTAGTTTTSPAACRWRPILAELFGRSTGLLGGKGGSMHLTRSSTGSSARTPSSGRTCRSRSGAAWSAQYRRSGQVAVCFFGDGTTNIGAFHEALNMAAVWKAPGRVRLREQPVHGIHADRRRDRRRAARRGSGQPPTAWSRSSSTATTSRPSTRSRPRQSARARAGDGPSLIEAVTYRHGGHSRADPGTYRPDDEVAAWMARDPIPAYRARLEAAGVDAASSTRSTPRLGPRWPRPRPRRAAAPEPAADVLETQVWSDGGSAWRN